VTRLDGSADRQAFDLTKRLAADLAHMDMAARLPLMDMAIPSLRELSQVQCGVFKREVEALIAADAELDLFEWVLRRVIIRHLEPHFAGHVPRATHYYSLQRLGREIEVLLSTLAHTGHRDPAQARAAFEAASKRIEAPPLELLPYEEAARASLDEALDRLAQTAPRLKRQIVEACAVSIVADREITVREGELLRAICDALDVPMPPLLPGQPIV
jgi:hypothetical protein